MTIDFYYIQGSPPSAIVSLTFATLGIESEVKSHFLDYMTDDHLKPEFVKINPQHTAPTIVDDGFVLWESRSIAKYLVTKYGNDKLYPKDLKTRAVVDQRLDFDLGTLFCRFSDYYYPYVLLKPLEEDNLKRVLEALGFLNTFLEGKKYAAGADLTLADLSLAVSVSFIEVVDISLKEYPNIVKWMKLVKSTATKYEEIVGKNTREFVYYIDLYRKRLMSQGVKG